MQLQAQQIAASPADTERDDLAYVHIHATDGYFLSLARAAESDLVEVIVVDQVNYKTNLVHARLTRKQLQISVPASVASQLDRHCSYEVLLNERCNVSELHQALSAIFMGLGTYEYSP